MLLTLIRNAVSGVLGFRRLPKSIDSVSVWPGGMPIEVPDCVALFNSFYVVQYDSGKKAAILSCAKTMPRVSDRPERLNDFCMDSRVNNGPRPGDYDGTGYDRGHLTPAGAADTEEHELDTFLMSNMTPQHPELNRGPWNILEQHVRGLDSTHIVTGAVYSNPPEVVLKAGIPVPAWYYKVVYHTDGTTTAFVANNTGSAEVVETNVDFIEFKTGLSLHRSNVDIIPKV